MQIVKEEYYRSQPLVNMDHDRVRVTMQMTTNELRELKRILDEIKKK